MKTEIVNQGDDFIVIEWVSEEAGFGQLTLAYDERGRYILDAEYMQIETIIKIFKAIKS